MSVCCFDHISIIHLFFFSSDKVCFKHFMHHAWTPKSWISVGQCLVAMWCYLCIVLQLRSSVVRSLSRPTPTLELLVADVALGAKISVLYIHFHLLPFIRCDLICIRLKRKSRRNLFDSFIKLNRDTKWYEIAWMVWNNGKKQKIINKWTTNTLSLCLCGDIFH